MHSYIDVLKEIEQLLRAGDAVSLATAHTKLQDLLADPGFTGLLI